MLGDFHIYIQKIKGTVRIYPPESDSHITLGVIESFQMFPSSNFLTSVADLIDLAHS